MRTLGWLAESRGDQLTWKILTDETKHIITRASVRSPTKTSPNLRLNPAEWEDQPQDLTSDMFVYGTTLMTFWGEHFCFLWMRMGREDEIPFLTMSTPWIKLKLPDKTNSGSDSKLM